MRGLYAIIDAELLSRRGLDPLLFADAVIAARPTAVQLRDKHGAPRDTLALLRALRERTRSCGTMLLANDRPDLAALADCDGVHLGQDDVAPAVAREVYAALRPSGPRPIIGMSVHDPVELAVALATQPDYLAFGPVFDTRNKAQPSPTIGVAGLEDLARRAASAAQPPLPWVAIGGIDLDRATQLRAIAPCIAVIGALVGDGATPYDDSRERAASLGRIMGGSA